MNLTRQSVSEFFFGKLIPESRDLLDHSKMAERREITDARVEGWIMGQKHGFNKGLAWGIGGMVLFYSIAHAVVLVVS